MVTGILVASAGSGAGKTSLTAGIARALRLRGIRVRCGKCGPDFLDARILTQASGLPCWNFDPWMARPSHLVGLAERARSRGEFLLVEGAMGLYDGVDPTSDEGSSAHVAQLLGLPTVLVLDARAQARTFAAVVEGLVGFSGIRALGVVANRVGSLHHADLLRRALQSRDLPPLLAGFGDGDLAGLDSRHLGLKTEAVEDGVLGTLAERVAARMELSGWGSVQVEAPAEEPERPSGGTVRLAVARDEAFQFVYADALDELRSQGVEIVETSPLRDSSLPDGIHGLWLCGGYPELHGSALSGNAAYLRSLRGFCESGRPVLAECGGMMLLCQRMVDAEGRSWPLAGVLEVEVRMGARLAALGHVEVDWAPGHWLSGCDPMRGHEFHWSTLEGAPEDGQPLFRAVASRGKVTGAGWRKGGTLATWVHLNLGGRPDAARAWRRAMEEVEPWNA